MKMDENDRNLTRLVEFNLNLTDIGSSLTFKIRRFTGTLIGPSGFHSKFNAFEPTYELKSFGGEKPIRLATFISKDAARS